MIEKAQLSKQARLIIEETAARLNNGHANTSETDQILKEAATTFYAAQRTLYLDNPRNAPVRRLIHERAHFFDTLLSLLWQQLLPQVNYCLIAIGGYGRYELFPHSDIDLLILCENIEQAEQDDALSQFIRSLWSLGLKIGSSVREISHCQKAISEDVNFATAVLEAHFVCGDWQLSKHFENAVKPGTVMSSRAFYEKKMQEQANRHRAYEGTGHNVEPNIKEGPGGLRDIHMIMWIAKFHYSSSHPDNLVETGYLSDVELRNLRAGQLLLWNFRFGLHLIAGRDENRLLFEYQQKLAQLHHYQDTVSQLAVEHAMHRYYRNISQVYVLNELILKHFGEDILIKHTTSDRTILNARFQINNHSIETRHNKVFHFAHFALLEIFLLIQKNLSIKEISARTLREMHHCLPLINDTFRNDIRHQSLFIEILKQPNHITRVFRIMHRHNILGAYIPAFKRIEGLMQFDLFHVYTVDAHTIMVLRNVRRFFIEHFAHEHPLAHDIAKTIPKPQILYIACLFHDIAKGRGGEHEILGQFDVEQFAQNHRLSRYDIHLCKWLVRHHLLLSLTAQKNDLNDPKVIEKFSNIIPHPHYLDALYLLSIADVKGTAPTLWNDFKNRLFTQLWSSARKRIVERDKHHAPAIEDIATSHYDEALAHLSEFIDMATIKSFWNILPQAYFQGHTPEQIVWHTATLLQAQACAIRQVSSRLNPGRDATEIIIFYPRRAYQLACIASSIDSANYTIMQASISRTAQFEALFSFTLLTHQGKPIHNAQDLEAISQKITRDLDSLEQTGTLPPLPKRLSDRRARHLDIPLRITFQQKDCFTDLDISCRDQPGLISLITRKLSDLHLLVIGARIRTVGARAEDTLSIATSGNQPIIDKALQQRIIKSITNALEA